MSYVNTVIFDFDGTLVDTFSLSVRVSNALAPLFGYRTVTAEEVPALRKLSLPELFKRLEVPKHRIPRLFATARKEIAQEMPSIQLFEGMATVLDDLVKRGVELGIVTSNSTKNVKDCLRQNQVLDLFGFVHSAHNLFGKHRTLLRLMKKRSIPSDRVLYVGDESRDIEASRKCHIPIAAVTWGFQAREKLLGMQPDFVAERPEDILRIVAKTFGLGRD